MDENFIKPILDHTNDLDLNPKLEDNDVVIYKKKLTKYSIYTLLSYIGKSKLYGYIALLYASLVKHRLDDDGILLNNLTLLEDVLADSFVKNIPISEAIKCSSEMCRSTFTQEILKSTTEIMNKYPKMKMATLTSLGLGSYFYFSNPAFFTLSSLFTFGHMVNEKTPYNVEIEEKNSISTNIANTIIENKDNIKNLYNSAVFDKLKNINENLPSLKSVWCSELLAVCYFLKNISHIDVSKIADDISPDYPPNIDKLVFGACELREFGLNCTYSDNDEESKYWLSYDKLNNEVVLSPRGTVESID